MAPVTLKRVLRWALPRDPFTRLMLLEALCLGIITALIVWVALWWD